MADNQFVPENQLFVRENSDLVNQSERSLYSSSHETLSRVFQLKNTGTVLFDANESAIKDFSSENGDLASRKNAGSDLKVPEVGEETKNQHDYLVKPTKSPCHVEHPKQESAEMKVSANDVELPTEKPSKSVLVTTTSGDIGLGRGMQQDAASYHQGPFQLSPFGVKAIESDEGRGGETIDFATLAEWSGILQQKNKNPMDKMNLDDNQTVNQQQLRSILRKEEADNTVTKAELKSVHFGFPVVWTKYFTSDEDNESTASTELLFSDEEDEVLDTEDQEVPDNENHDEPCAKKARKDDGSFEVPSFSFPEVISIPNLQMLRFTDEDKDHDMIEVTNEPAKESNLKVDEHERKREEFHHSSYPEEFHTPDENNQEELVESLPNPVTPGYVPDKDTSCLQRQTDASKDTSIRQHNETDKPSNPQVLKEQLPSKSHGADRNPELFAEVLSELGDDKQHDQLPKELGSLNSDDASDCTRTAKVPCLKLGQANMNRGSEPDYVESAEVTCCDLKASHPEYEKSAEPCLEMLQANRDDHPDHTKTAELPSYDHVQANDSEYEKRSAEVPCHELFPANKVDHPECSVKSANEDKVPDVNELCQHDDTEMEEQLQLLKVLVLSSDDLKHQSFSDSEVPCSNVPQGRYNQDCQHNDTMGQQKSHLRQKLTDGQINDNPEHGKSDILPCRGMLHVPDALDETQQNQLKEVVPINHNSNSDDREKATEDTSEESFSFSSQSERASQSLVSERNGLPEMQLVQAEKTFSTSLSMGTAFTVEDTQEVPETGCSSANDHLPTGVCSSLLRLGEECLLDEACSEPNTSPVNSEKTWMYKEFLKFEDLSLYENDCSFINGRISKTNEDVTQKMETPSLSPVRNSWAKTSFEEEFDSCDNDDDSCSSQISEISEEVKNLLAMDSTGCENPRPQSSDCSTNDNNQEEYKKLAEPKKYSAQFLEALERDACSLDGPELLEMAMHLVESAMRKSKSPSRIQEERPGSSAESNKASQTELKATPAFSWKKFSYESQRATLNVDNQDKNDNDGTKNNSTDYKKLYYNKSCTRPLRVGLSRRNRNHSLHPYAARPRSGNTLINHEASEYNPTK